MALPALNYNPLHQSMALNIGILSTRLAGTDGVSLETAKWVKVLNHLGHQCFFFAGESEWPQELSNVVPEAHFLHPEIMAINGDLFDVHRRKPETSHKISSLTKHLKKHLQRFVRHFQVDMLIVENALSLPMNIPLGLAITELIAESGLPTIAHHHDFHWERERYAVDAASDYLRAAFPPTLDHIQHVVINSYAERQLALNAGVTSTIIPNVMDFNSMLPELDGYCTDMRKELGLQESQYLLLQPTRVIPRKRIEKAIELARRLEMDCSLVITHECGDEGLAYKDYLYELAKLLGVDLIFAAERIGAERFVMANGKKIYSLFDIYQEADLVTYPSHIEGFGNALLEAIYCRRPIVTSPYRILKSDLRPKGFQFIELDEFFQDDFLEQVRKVLRNPNSATEMIARNYEIGRRFYSFNTLETKLADLLRAVQNIPE